MPSNVLWVIQSNLGNDATLTAFREAFTALDVPHREVAAVPFSDELPEVAWDGPAVFYGATRFIERARASGRWAPCAFFDPERFRFSYWRRAHGSELLNADAEETTLAAFAQSPRDPDSLWFVRPDNDSKAFAGEVVRFGDARAWIEGLVGRGFTLEGDEPIVVAEPVHVRREWRLFVVDGRVVAQSQYRVDFRLSVDPRVPPEVVAYGDARAAACPVAPVFVLDVAETAAGLRVIEINCFNSAGFYAADLGRIVAAVNASVERGRARSSAPDAPPRG